MKLQIYVLGDNLKAFLFTYFKNLTIEYEMNFIADTCYLNDLILKGKKSPDIVIVEMCKDNLCLEQLKELKKRRAIETAIFVVFTQNDNPENAEQAFLAGANICLNKNMEKSRLKKSLDTLTSVCWQYINDGLDKEIFLLNLV